MQNIICYEKKVSLCILPMDDFTNEIYKGKLDILIDDVNLKPIKKPSGMYIYTNLTNSKVKLTVHSLQFLDYESIIDIDSLDRLNPIVQIRLKANDRYLYPATASGLSFTIMDNKNKPLINTRLYCYINNMTSFIGLIEKPIKRNDRQIYIYSIYEKNIEYRALKIVSDKETEKDEYILLGKMLEDNCYEIISELESEHSAKDKLLCASIVETDDTGKAKLVFNRLNKAISELTVEVKTARRTKELSLTINEGKIADIGNVILI